MCQEDILSKDEIKWVQQVVSLILFYRRAVDKKLLVALSTLATEAPHSTNSTIQATKQLLDYVATYPNDGIIYRASGMQLAVHSDAGFNNKKGAKSRAGAHIFCSEDVPVPEFNGSILTIAKIIKFVVGSAPEVELAALYITANKCIELCQTLAEMGWPQVPTPIQVDNTTASGIANKVLVPKQLKSMDLRLHWLRCRQAREQL